MDCHKFIEEFEQFSERCLRMHSLFNSLISSTDLEIDSNYLQTLRYEAGLDRDEVSKVDLTCMNMDWLNIEMKTKFD